MNGTSCFVSMASRSYCSNRSCRGPSVMHGCHRVGAFCPEAPQVMAILKFYNLMTNRAK